MGSNHHHHCGTDKKHRVAHEGSPYVVVQAEESGNLESAPPLVIRGQTRRTKGEHLSPLRGPMKHSKGDSYVV